MTSLVRIVALLATAAVVAVPVARPASLGSTPLDGRWTFVWPSAALHKCCDPRVPAGRYVVEFRDGQVTRLLPKPVLRGLRFTVSGSLATFVFPRGVPGTVPGRHYVMRWSIYRDRLTWSSVPGRAPLGAFVITPWIRVR